MLFGTHGKRLARCKLIGSTSELVQNDSSRLSDEVMAKVDSGGREEGRPHRDDAYDSLARPRTAAHVSVRHPIVTVFLSVPSASLAGSLSRRPSCPACLRLMRSLTSSRSSSPQPDDWLSNRSNSGSKYNPSESGCLCSRPVWNSRGVCSSPPSVRLARDGVHSRQSSRGSLTPPAYCVLILLPARSGR